MKRLFALTALLAAGVLLPLIAFGAENATVSEGGIPLMTGPGCNT